MAEHPQDRAQREFWGGTGRLLQATAEQESRTITFVDRPKPLSPSPEEVGVCIVTIPEGPGESTSV